MPLQVGDHVEVSFAINDQYRYRGPATIIQLVPHCVVRSPKDGRYWVDPEKEILRRIGAET
jgi:hypothetical protein